MLPPRRFVSLLALVLALSAVSAAAAPPPARTDTSILTVVPAADEQPAMWRYTTTDPGSGWTEPRFDDSKWQTGLAGFGTKGTPGAVIGTEWKSTNIWLRRTFVLPDPVPTSLRLWLIYDEAPAIYLNGTLAATRKGWIAEYDEAEIRPEALITLRPGTNQLAVSASQTWGGQCIDVGLVNVRPYQLGPPRWDAARAAAWFNRRLLPIGFNYVPANSISYTEMWMEHAFDPKLIDRELALAQQIGFNCLRVVLPFVVWEADPAAFKRRFETFLSIAHKRGLTVMPCFFDDCVFGTITDPEFGPQPPVVPGWYANGWTPSPGHQRARDPQVRPALKRYVQDILKPHRRDSRILCWDLYNEAGNSGMGNSSMSLLRDVFSWARSMRLEQPITSGVWGGPNRITSFLLAESDIITFHNYESASVLRRKIAICKSLGRPVIATEWLNRGLNSTVQTCLPVFVEEKVGCLHWGLVNGKTQTHLPWGHRPGDPEPKVWQHDIFRADETPYDPEEIELFRRAIRQAGAAAGRGSH